MVLAAIASVKLTQCFACRLFSPPARLVRLSDVGVLAGGRAATARPLTRLAAGHGASAPRHRQPAAHCALAGLPEDIL